MEALFITIGIIQIMNGLQLKNEIGNYSYLCSQKSSPNENPLWVSTKGAMPEFMGSNCWRYRVENQYTIKLMEVLEIKIV